MKPQTAALGLLILASLAARAASQGSLVLRTENPDDAALSSAVGRLLDPEVASNAAPSEPVPALCRTVLLDRALESYGKLRPEAQALLTAAVSRPSSTGEVLPAGERVWAHAPAPAARGLASEAARAVARVRAALLDPAFPRSPLDVYFQAPAGAAGTVIWDGVLAPRPVGIAVSPTIPRDELRMELVHQLVHVWQLERGAGTRLLPPAWMEGSAVYVSCVAAPPADGPAAALARAVSPAILLRNSPRDAAEPSLLRARSSLPAFLCESTSGDLRPLLSLYGRLHAGWPRALEETLREAGFLSVASFEMEHALWLTLSSEPEAASRYFSFGPLLPRASGRDLDDREASASVLEPFAHDVLLLDGAPHDGGSWITVEPALGDAASVRAAVIVRRASGELRVAPIPRAADGSLRIGVPLRAVRDCLVVVANASERAIGIEARVEHDPIFPYVLSSFTTEATASGIMVQWTVTEEEGIAGWRVMRSRDPAQGFLSVSALPIPGRGEAHDPLTYYFLDQTAKPRERYFYYLEGVSKDGLGQPSFMVSVTTGSP